MAGLHALPDGRAESSQERHLPAAKDKGGTCCPNRVDALPGATPLRLWGGPAVQYVSAVVFLAIVFVLLERIRHLQRANFDLGVKLQQEKSERDAQAILITRMLRHSFLNDLQIITGWLQLGNAARAGSQAEHVRDRLVREGQLMRVKPAGLVHGILNRGAWAEANGVKMTYVVAADLAGYEDLDKAFAGPVSDALGGLVEALQAADGHECTVTVGLSGATPVIDVAADAAIDSSALPDCGPGVTLSRLDEGGQSAFRLTVARG